MKWIAGLLCALTMFGTALAQDEVRPHKVDDLVRLLQDPEVRSWLETAPASIAPPVVEKTDNLSVWETAARTRIRGTLEAIPAIPDAVKAAALKTRTEALSYGGVPVFMIFIGLIAVGLVAEKFLLRSRHRTRLSDRLLAIGVFSVAMAVVFFAFDWPPLTRIVLLVCLMGLVAFRSLAAVLDAVALPPSSRARTKLFAAVAIAGVATAVLGAPMGTDPNVASALSFCFSVVLLALATEGVIALSGKSVRKKLVMTVILVAIWGLWVAGLPGLFWIAVYAVALPSVLRFVGHAVAGIVPSEAKATRRVLIVRGSRAVVVIIAVAWLATVWRLDPNSLVHSNPAVTAVSYGLLKSVVVLLLADLVWHLAKSWIDRSLASSVSVEDATEAARQGRLRTLLPIFRNVLAVIVAVVAGLVVLAELGVEIGPLIAGAGVFGVALGFGSQTLVKDIISGVFYMLDDAFRVGEYIQAKSYKGTVEGFSLRSVRLRHHRGPVYTVPFGELGAVENMSRDWGVVKFRISVSYDTDVEKARKLTKKIGVALAENPEFAPLFMEPLKMKGVEEFGDYGMVLSFGMTLRPSGLQSMIRRRANLMIREAFMENGIEFAQPTMQVGGDEKQAAAVTSVRIQEAKAAPSTPT
jgi:small-conductance mechanosensitive channel